MRAYKGLVKDGKIILAENVDLPEGAIVSVTLGEAEYIRATLRSALRRNRPRKRRARVSAGVPALKELA